MRAVRLCFYQMLEGIRRDMMLIAACAAPLLIGVAFKLGLPALDAALNSYLHAAATVSPYYEIADIFFSMVAPIMFCFVTAMTVLEEADDGVSKYLFITPLGRTGYLAARFGIPALIAFAATLALLPVFKLTALTAGEVVFLSASGTLQAITVSLIIITLSSNKLEGLALAKLSTVIMLGFIAPYFIRNGVMFAFAPLASFWIGMAIRERSAAYMPAALAVSALWIAVLMRRYLKKLA